MTLATVQAAPVQFSCIHNNDDSFKAKFGKFGLDTWMAHADPARSADLACIMLRLVVQGEHTPNRAGQDQVTRKVPTVIELVVDLAGFS